MRKVILTGTLLLFATYSFCQGTKTNGTIYINHPNIDAVNKAMDAYMKKDDATNMSIYSDTAKFWISGSMEKPVGIKDAMKMWDSDFDYYDSIKVKAFGYPDYLEYAKDDARVVQSWWKWSGKSKKTGDMVTIDLVQFDDFNKDGKIVFETLYGDFSKMVKD